MVALTVKITTRSPRTNGMPSRGMPSFSTTCELRHDRPTGVGPRSLACRAPPCPPLCARPDEWPFYTAAKHHGITRVHPKAAHARTEVS